MKGWMVSWIYSKIVLTYCQTDGQMVGVFRQNGSMDVYIDRIIDGWIGRRIDGGVEREVENLFIPFIEWLIC
jgi:hypothetical protein